jgi:hypothetical protein
MKQKLARQRDHYMTQVKLLTVERDDLKGAVLELVEKGGFRVADFLLEMPSDGVYASLYAHCRPLCTSLCSRIIK